jgi:hypothetical protein
MRLLAAPVAPAAPAAPAASAAAAPILLYSKPKILKGIKVYIRYDILFSSDSV